MDLRQLLIEELTSRIETTEYNMAQGGKWVDYSRDWLEGRNEGYRSVLRLLGQ